MEHFEEGAMRFSIQEDSMIFEWLRLYKGRLKYVRQQSEHCLKVKHLFFERHMGVTELGASYDK